MNFPASRNLAGAASLAALCAAPLLAVQYGPQAFVFDDGTTNLGDGTTLASSDGTAGVIDGNLMLTEDGTPNTASSFRIPALAASSDGWTASFEFALFDGPENGIPADGFSFSYGAIPAFNPGQADPHAADAHGSGEEGWHPSVTHLAFEFDTYPNTSGEQGLTISLDGVDLAFESIDILPDGQMVLGQAVLSWDPDDGASMSVDLGSGLTPVFANVPTPGFAGNDAYSFAFSARTGGNSQSLTLDNVRVTTIPPGFVVLPTPVISEFMADNETILEDEDCRNSDWIEVFNATAEPVNLGGWYLTDDPNDLTRWMIPDLPLAPNEHKLIFASGKDQREGELHTDFSLEKDGEYLALVMPNGVTIASAYAFGPQVADIAYGSLGQAQTLGSFSTATPGALNVPPQGNLILDRPVFSLDNQVITGPVTLELSTAVPGATIRYSTNATDPNIGSQVYSNPIQINTTTRVSAWLTQPGKEPGPLRDRTFVKLDGSMLNVASELPLIIIDSFGRNIDLESSANSQNPLRPVHGIFIDVDPATSRSRATDLPDFEGRGGMRVRGQTSAGFPKKQYSFETWDSDGNDKDVSIFGFPAESDWVIHAPYSDKTLMRNKIVYDTSREIGYPASRTRFCEVYYNANGGDVSSSDYRGVFVFMEKIKANGDRVDLKDLENCDNTGGPVTGGYMFKKDKGSPSANITFYTERENHRMEIIEPSLPTSAQRFWIDRHMDLFENALYHATIFADPARGYPSYLNVRSFIDTHIWVEVYKNIDGYRLSSYFYKDRGRKIVASPVWDYNLSLGNADYLTGEFPNGWYYTQLGGQDYPWYGRLFQDPEFVIQYWDRWFELREGILSTASLMGRVDAENAEIRRAAIRNFGRWNILGTHLWPNARTWTPPPPLPGSDRNLAGAANRTTHRDEVDWMKGWLWARLDWIDSQHSKPPVFNQPSGPLAPGNTLTITDPNGGGQIYYTTDGSDPRLRGGSVAPGAVTYSGALPLDTSMTVRARARVGANWSPLQTEYYLVDGEPASAATLAVTELDYRPATGTVDEMNRGFDERTEFEFVEVMNIGAVAIDLAGVRFTNGIDFSFDLGEIRWLAPGERAVLVNNRDAFELRYSSGLSGIRIAGEFTNNLSNDGETITLSAADGADIRHFTFNDQSPWPEAADGSGSSLVLINPTSNPDHNDPVNWRASLAPSGNPGTSDGTQFAGDPNGDDDGNGVGNLLQYAIASPGGTMRLPVTGIAPYTVENVTNDYMILSYSRNMAADDLVFAPQVSEDLVNWLVDSDGVFVLVSRVDNGDGTETITYRMNEPRADAAQLFGRLLVQAAAPTP